MKLPKYKLKSGHDFLSFEFISEGPKGLIVKQIQFTLVSEQDVYNLAFGDKDPLTGVIDDLVVSNNGDSEKVLATVVAAVFAFFQKHPQSWIFASGSTAGRTRLYQMGISRFYDDIQDKLEIYGQIGEEWHAFEKNKEYVAFLAKQKTS